MKITILKDHDPRTVAAVFAEGDDPLAGLTRLAKEHDLGASAFTAIGAFSSATLGFFDLDKRDYQRIPVTEQAEVVSLTGNVSVLEDGTPKLHIHAVLGLRDGRAVAGHLLEARVRPTLEVILTETPGHLVRHMDAKTGIPLLTGAAR